MTDTSWVLDHLKNVGAVTSNSHFVYTSGMHGHQYINMDFVFPDVATTMQMCSHLTASNGELNTTPAIDVVIGAATGGIPLAVLTAIMLDGALAVWADKSGKDFVIERAGFAEVLNRAKVLVVEDLLNTGGTTKKVIAAARACGADIVGVSVICNRGDQTAETLGVPWLHQLSSVNFEAYDKEECMQCFMAVPIVNDVGHGDEYQATHPDYPGGYTTLLS